jgi:hypothetical protein
MPAATITDLGDRLVAAFEAKGLAVGDNLQPGLSRDAILAAVRPLGIELPEEVIALYEWRNGHAEEFPAPKLNFRDNALLTLEQAIEEYQRLTEDAWLEQAQELYGLDLARSFPVAGFEGSVYVVAWGDHPWTDSPRPVVQVFEDVDRYFHSLPRMFETAHAWVSHPDWQDDSLDADLELEIWQRFNPGVFADNEEE